MLFNYIAAIQLICLSVEKFSRLTLTYGVMSFSELLKYC